MKIGITLPQFRDEPGPALDAARVAEAMGVHGVFVFDHLHAIGQPHRPALTAFPLLGALAATTDRLRLGPLVARVGLVPDAVLLHQFRTLRRMVGDRLVAGLGTGDAKSRMENEAYGISYESAPVRRAQVARLGRQLRAEGLEVWIGGTAERTRQTAVEAGADALNLWEALPSAVAAERRLPVTWGGVVPSHHEALVQILEQLQDAGATWAVCAPAYGTDTDPRPAIAAVVEAAAGAGVTS